MSQTQSAPVRTLAEMLEAVPHRHVILDDGRPEWSVWANYEDGKCSAVMMLSAIWGEPSRFVELSPLEARQIARHLLRTADDIDHLRGRAAADAVRANGGSAMEAAKAHIAETFANSFKGV